MASRRNSRDAGNIQPSNRHHACKFKSDKSWLDLQLHENGTIKKPDELENGMQDPHSQINADILDRVHGSMVGMALGDALGAHVEFRPHEYMVANPVTNLKGGGTWGLEKGQFTDDTSMALCLANSLVARRGYVPYDQLVRYKWWYRDGYMSSTGKCFDIGAATKKSLAEFEHRQKLFAKEHGIPPDQLDFLSDSKLLKEFDVNCSDEGVAGNGALMRLAPVPLFFYQHPTYAVKYSGLSGKITHGDDKAYDACRYYGALIVAAVNGGTREQLLDKKFYDVHKEWFGNEPLHPDIENIARGSYQKKGGYAKGIRGKGYIVSALEAALWAFWSDEDSFEKGVLAAINLGDDTDTTAAIYGQLAGAYHGYENLPKKWVEQLYAKKFIACLSKWIVYEGMIWSPVSLNTSNVPSVIIESSSKFGGASPLGQEINSYEQQPSEEYQKMQRQQSINRSNTGSGSCLTFEQTTEKPTDYRGRSRTYNDASATLTAGSIDHYQNNRPSSAERLTIYSSENLNTCKDVCKWLRTLGKDYTAYAPIFTRHNIDGYWLLNQVNNKNLREYGIVRDDHRQTILDKVYDLKQTQCKVTVVPEKTTSN